MRSRSILPLTVVFAGAAFVLTSCSAGVSRRPPGHHHETVTVVQTGPPPHAPAHGYRHKHQGVVLVFERDLDVYRVESHSGYYFYGSYFYRVNGGGWQASLGISGPWRNVPDYRLPGKLLDHHYAQADKKHWKKNHKNKHR